MRDDRLRANRAGRLAEMAAVVYLVLRGYRIVHRRYKCKLGEIDILARKGRALVAVEVKYRRDFEAALQSVHNKNRARVENAARYFLAGNPRFSGYDIRFDALVFGGRGRFAHLDNAWEARS